MSVKKRKILQRNGQKQLKFVVDYIDVSGIRRRKQFDLRKDAEAYNASVISLRNKGQITETNKTMTFKDGAEYFMNNHAKLHCKPSVVDTYNWYLNKYLLPYFGNMRIINIKKDTINKFMLNLKDNTELSNKSINKFFSLLSLILQKLVENELLVTNPAKGIKKLKEEKKEMRALEIEEIQELLQAFKSYNNDFYPVIFTALHTGMRRGELLALQWSKIDFKKKTIRIDKSLYNNQFVQPKTKSSLRTIEVTDELLKVLKEWKLKSKPNKFDLVFPNSEGNPMDARNMVRREFDTVVAKTSIGHFRWHDLRHTYASVLLANKADIKFVQKQLGHSSIRITLDTYGHLLRGACDEALSIISNIMQPKKVNLVKIATR